MGNAVYQRALGSALGAQRFDGIRAHGEFMTEIERETETETETSARAHTHTHTYTHARTHAHGRGAEHLTADRADGE